MLTNSISMKKTATFLRSLFALLFVLVAWKSNAQICGATNSLSCSVDWLSAVTFKNSTGTQVAFTGLTCANTGATNKLMTNGAMMNVTPGEDLTVTIENTCTYPEYVGIWLDLDGDNLLSAAECLSTQSAPFGSIASNSTKTAKVTVPCLATAKAGKAILRVRCMYSAFTASQGCGTVSNYGNIMDFEVNVQSVSAPAANFTVPTGPNYIKTPITFNSTQTNPAYNQVWQFNGGTAVNTFGPKGKGKWGANGTYDVQLNQSFCGLKDSIIKSVKIITPTAAPVADFIASDNQVEVFYTFQLNDLSTNGAYKWSWEITSPTGNVYTDASQNPTFMLDELGKWDVCLTSANDIGPSTKVCKSKYVDCIPPSEFYLGPNHLATNQGGTLYDNGGPTLNYGNSRKVTIDYFKILPCGAKEIRLKFKQMRFADASDKLTIYDGYDEGGVKLTPPGGINSTNQATYKTMTFKAYSGAMYITFESNASGNDSGFIAFWDSDLNPPSKPVSGWTTDYNPAAIGMNVQFNQDVKKAQGDVTYEWQVDGNPGMGNKATFNYQFTTSNTYDVCLVASTCNGDDTACDQITIFTPTGPGIVDYSADLLRPKVGEVVKITTKTDFASNFEWSIFPTTFSYVNGTTKNSQNPNVVFNAGGPYTFSLKAWNSIAGQALTEKKVIKSKYVIAVTYCIPPVDLLSADVGINRVELSVGGNSLLDNETTSGDVAYTDYTDNTTTLNFGTKYDLRVSRRTNSNPVNFKVWIDYNIDGDFDDVNEEIMNTGSMTGYDKTVSFIVPSFDQCYAGTTRMRVASAYGTFSNTSCGVNMVGEFEDYGLVLSNDNLAPVITLIGADTLRVEKGVAAGSCYKEIAGTTYKGTDPSQGDITGDVKLTSDLDCTIPGIYYIDFQLADAAGNQAPKKRRTVIVVLDKTPPTITLNGSSPMTIEQCDNFTDPGAIAFDLVDGDVTSAIKVVGNVDASKVGTYKIVYSVKDAQENEAVFTRDVIVKDTKKPGIYEHNNRIVNNAIIPVQIGSLFLDDVYAEDYCNGSINVTKTAGFNGQVNTLVRATYPITYNAMDPSGNKADEDGYVINYRVDDYIAPEISLNTADTIVIDVNSAYSSQQVTVFDNYYPANKVSVAKSGIVDAYKLGVYAEKYTATDESGNVGTKTRYVKVVDREAPDIVSSSVSLCVGTPFWAMSDLIVTDNYYSMDVLMPLVTVVSHNVNIWKAGLYYVNYQVTDPSGNKSQVMLRPVMVQYPPDCENSIMGTKKLSLSAAVAIYPNPSIGVVTIGYALTNNEPLQVEVFSATGSKVADFSYQNNGFGTQNMDLGKYGNGAYLIRIPHKQPTKNQQTTPKNQ